MASAAKVNGTSSAKMLVEKQKAHVPRPSRPNYNKLHALPLPVEVYPLPPLIPHNPLSILQIVFTYFRQVVVPPSSHPKDLYLGYYSPETRSVHVTDEVAVRVLWERGFFGKGSLSRSEPSWLDREKRRLGIVAGETSEEVIRKRREERKEFKKERAKKEREAIEEKLAEESMQQQGKKLDTLCEARDEPAKELVNGSLGSPVELQASSNPTEIKDINSDADSNKETVAPNSPNVQFSTEANPELEKPLQPKEEKPAEATPIKNQEHLQLTLEEALFLSYGLGILSIIEPTTSNPLSTSSLFTLSRQTSYFPPAPLQDLQPDDPFILSYVVYHHFRSLGWVVRPGIKFAVDYLLYLRGPVFTHAQFAVIILPNYVHEYWRSAKQLEKTRKKETKSWWWVHCVNRVQTQVRKSLVLVYVEVPPSEAIESPGVNGEKNEAEQVDVALGKLLKQYKVRELTLKRWSPNRGKGWVTLYALHASSPASVQLRRPTLCHLSSKHIRYAVHAPRNRHPAPPSQLSIGSSAGIPCEYDSKDCRCAALRPTSLGTDCTART